MTYYVSATTILRNLSKSAYSFAFTCHLNTLHSLPLFDYDDQYDWHWWESGTGIIIIGVIN